MLDRALERIETTTGRSREAAVEALIGRNPLRRFVRPDEVADAVAWLCREESAAINGQSIVVDGGEVTP
jgi:NAD(P)-dependent dehydrogenase (short-subunit alcohol dehydrogenase family)